MNRVMHQEPVLAVLVYSALAAFSAIFGALPFALLSGVGRPAIGNAYSGASGLMLAVSYLLAVEGLDLSFRWTVAGAAIGVAYTWGAQRFAGTTELQQDNEQIPDGIEYGYKIILQNTLHSASEGLAIGVAMAVQLPLGIFMALALAVHNIGEAMALTSLLSRRGVSLGHSAALCVVTNSTQVLLAIVAFSLAQALISWLPLVLGMAAGALVFLVMTELLPSSYRHCRKSHVAFLVSATIGTVLVLEELFV